jgi:hypothetical protein
MVRLAIILALTLGATTANAALPPYFQRTAEIKAIIESGAVADLLQAPIDSIERVENDHYRVRAGACTLDVLIVDDSKPDAPPGPRRFKLELGKGVCK